MKAFFISLYKRYQTCLKLLITITLFYLILRGTDLFAIWDEIAQVNLSVLALNLLLYNSRVLLLGWRWQYIISDLVPRVRLSFLTQLHFVSIFFSNFLPTSVGGDVIRGILFHQKYKIDVNMNIGILVTERFLGVAGLSLMVLVTSFLYLDENIVYQQAIYISIILLCGFTILLSVISFRHYLFGETARKLFVRAEEILCILAKMPKRKILIALMMSIMIHLVLVVNLYFLNLMINANISFDKFLIVCSVSILISSLPITINGYGLREGTFVWLFMQLGVAKEISVTFMTLWLIMALIQSLIGGVIYLAQKNTNIGLKGPTT